MNGFWNNLKNKAFSVLNWLGAGFGSNDWHDYDGKEHKGWLFGDDTLFGNVEDTVADVLGADNNGNKGSFFGTAGFWNALTSYLNSKTGVSLTGAQREQNVFNAEQAAIQRGYEERLSNTAYQRGVVDMEQAGLNPALMYGSGAAAATPSGAVASGGSPSVSSELGLMSLLMQSRLKKQELKNAKEIAKNQSDTAIKTAQIASDAQVESAKIQERWQTRGQDINEALTRENITLANRELDLHEYLTTAQVDEINRNIDLIREKISSEQANSVLAYAQSRLANTQSGRIKMLLSAEYTNLILQGELTDAQRVEALAGQYLKTTEAAWKAGLIDGGMIDSMIKESSANAALRQRLVDIKNGKPFKEDYGDLRDIPNKLLNIVFGNVVQAIDAVGGAIVGSLIK